MVVQRARAGHRVGSRQHRVDERLRPGGRELLTLRLPLDLAIEVARALAPRLPHVGRLLGEVGRARVDDRVEGPRQRRVPATQVGEAVVEEAPHRLLRGTGLDVELLGLTAQARRQVRKAGPLANHIALPVDLGGTASIGDVLADVCRCGRAHVAGTRDRGDVRRPGDVVGNRPRRPCPDCRREADRGPVLLGQVVVGDLAGNLGGRAGHESLGGQLLRQGQDLLGPRPSLGEGPEATCAGRAACELACDLSDAPRRRRGLVVQDRLAGRAGIAGGGVDQVLRGRDDRDLGARNHRQARPLGLLRPPEPVRRLRRRRSAGCPRPPPARRARSGRRRHRGCRRRRARRRSRRSWRRLRQLRGSACRPYGSGASVTASASSHRTCPSRSRPPGGQRPSPPAGRRQPPRSARAAPPAEPSRARRRACAAPRRAGRSSSGS